MTKCSLNLFFALAIAGGICLGDAAYAGMLKVSSGTGFFITRRGDLITSAHVLDQCERVLLQGNFSGHAEAEIVATDKDVDLALLHTDIDPPNIGYLRLDSTPPSIGDKVMLLGYPEEYAGTGQYDVTFSRILSFEGPSQEPYWIQFENSARHGNSGGPLLDEAGNIIGVITGKTERYEINELNNTKKIISSSDVAVNLKALHQFLMQQNIYTFMKDSMMTLSDSGNERRSKDFVVNVLCIQGAVEQEQP